MKILNYSFYGETSSYFYMNVKMQMVKYGSPGKSNWGTYFYCYDKNGAMLKSVFLYASGLRVGGTYYDDNMIPIGTAKIEFIEYPDGSDFGSDPGDAPDDGGKEEEEDDPMLWSYSDILKVEEYADQAYEYVISARNSADKGAVYASIAAQYLGRARQQLQNAKALIESKYDLNLTDGTTLTDKIEEALADFETLDTMGSSLSEVKSAAYELAVTTAAFRTLIAKIKVDILS